VSICALAALDVLGAEQSEKPEPKVAELVNLGLEDLMNLRVTSVSRRSERLADAAASIFVITAEEIRRPRDDVELSLTSQNLFDPGHGEFTEVSTRTEIGRSWFFELLWRW